jgi:hypothetical protein
MRPSDSESAFRWLSRDNVCAENHWRKTALLATAWKQSPRAALLSPQRTDNHWRRAG